METKTYVLTEVCESLEVGWDDETLIYVQVPKRWDENNEIYLDILDYTALTGEYIYEEFCRKLSNVREYR